MSKKIYDIVNDFLIFEDVKDTRKTLWNMYSELMMSDTDLSTEDRKGFTFLYIRFDMLLKDIVKIHKELSKEFGRSKDLPPS